MNFDYDIRGSITKEEEPNKDFFERMSNAMRWALWFGVAITILATIGYFVYFNDYPNGWWVAIVCTIWLMIASGWYMKLENPAKI